MLERIKSHIQQVDFPFLIFLLGISSIKLQIKAIVICAYFFYLLISKVSFKNTKATPIWFYLSMAVVGTVSSLIQGAYTEHSYWLGNVIGIVIWLLCALSFFIILNKAKSTSITHLLPAINIFFIINTLVCIFQFFKMVYASQHLFPYWYNELDYIYGVSSGDHIKGIFLDNSSVNAAVCLMACLFYVQIKYYKMAMLMATMSALSTSNYSMIILGFSLLCVVLVDWKNVKSILKVLTYTVFIYVAISPNNFSYIQRVIGSFSNKVGVTQIEEKTQSNKRSSVDDAEDTTPVDEELLKSNKPSLSQIRWYNIAHQNGKYSDSSFPYKEILKDFKEPVINSIGAISLGDKYKKPIEQYDELQQVMTQWYQLPYDSIVIPYVHKPGKVLYLQNTLAYIIQSPMHFLFGAGIGNFSSKMALKMTGLQLQGSYPDKYVYMSKPYFENTFYVFSYFWAKSQQARSSVNYPGSVYAQVLGEYGFLGAILFATLYLFYMLKLVRKTILKLPLLIALLLLFFFDYWFEMLTLTVFFELFMLIEYDSYNMNDEKVTYRKMNEA